MKKFLRNLVLREKASSEKFTEYLRNKGVDVGEHTYFFAPKHTSIDLTAPWLLSIGDNVNITQGVIILTHDFSWSVLKLHKVGFGKVLGAQSPVKIGNNVFIGMNAIITRGVTINDNVIIGAGSVVTNDCESDSIYAGSPAKRIMSIEEFFYKRDSKQFEEAKALALRYKEKFAKMPPKEIFYEYFMLFSTAQQALDTAKFRSRLGQGCEVDASLEYMKTHKPMFDSYEDFLKECFKE